MGDAGLSRSGDQSSGANDLELELELDERIRRELDRAIPSGEAAGAVLEAMSPALRRAKQTQTLKEVTAGLVVSALLVVGVGYALPQFNEQSVTVAGEPETATSASPEVSEPVVVQLPSTTQLTATVTTDTEADENFPDDQAAAETSSPLSDSGEAEPLPQVAPPGLDDQEPTTPPPVTTTVPDTPAQTQITQPPEPNTTTSSSSDPSTKPEDETEITSRCGSISVLVSNSKITLINVEPETGYTADVKSSDEDGDVEVSFEGEQGHCELKAELNNGELEISKEE